MTCDCQSVCPATQDNFDKPFSCKLLSDWSIRNRKVLEGRSYSDEEKIEFLEKQLKEARVIAEDIDSKYDEVNTYVLNSARLRHPL